MNQCNITVRVFQFGEVGAIVELNYLAMGAGDWQGFGHRLTARAGLIRVPKKAKFHE